MFKKLKKPTRKVDKLLKGAIVGGAVASVIGVGITVKKKKAKPSQKKSVAQRVSLPLPRKTKPKKKGLIRSIFGGVFALIFGRKRS